VVKRWSKDNYLLRDKGCLLKEINGVLLYFLLNLDNCFRGEL